MNSTFLLQFGLMERINLVQVTDDGHGNICPGISHGGIGKIVEIRRDDTDHFFGVLMNNREFGFMKDARIKRVLGKI